MKKSRVCLILLAWSITLSSAQLPFQVAPKVRGFLGKRKDEYVSGRNVADSMYRLNNSFIPFHYELEIRVILDSEGSAGEQFTAPGKVRVLGQNQDQTSSVVLHANDLIVNESSIIVTSQDAPRENISVLGVSKDENRDFLTIELGRELRPSEQLELLIEFEAKIIDDEKGLFYRTYRTEQGEEKRVAATQLQAVDARRLFPCFDEPDLKATFELSVIRRSNYSSLSNTDLVSSSPDPHYPGWVIDKYSKTPPMSAYLLAFSVLDYDFVEAQFGNKPARTYGPRHLIKAGGGNFSATVASKCLSFYESYFNESYKLPKMDSVAIPGYSGAMENWGMNVYGISYLIHWQGKDTEARRSLVALIIAHELAHQWFGNLVTAKWWNEIFLNEGLGTYMQYLGLQEANPEFSGLEYAILDGVQFSMLYDAGPNTHPLTMNVSTPDEIDGMFSTISYEKGASIFRMMEGVLTKETLRKGLQTYMKTFAFMGAVQNDLYDSLQKASVEDSRLPSGLTVHQIMHSWTEQSGFPLVKVGAINATHVLLSQQRFVNDGASDLEGLWHIPVTVVTRNNSKLENNIPRLWLANDGRPVTLKHSMTMDGWIMINQNATGFYRVLYDEPLQKLIQAQLESDEKMISPLSRSQLLDDYFTFAEEKYDNIQAALNFTTYLHKETHFTVWSTFFDHFSGIYEKFSSHPAYPLMKAYLQPKLDKALLTVGLEESLSHTGTLAILRADLLDWSCSLESPLCKEYAGMLFAKWKANPSIHPVRSLDARKTLECAMVAGGGKAAFDFIFERYRDAENDTNVRNDFLSALTCATDQVIINKLLHQTLNTSSGLVLADATTTLTKVALNPFGRILILNFLSENFDRVVEIVGEGEARPIADVLNTLATFISTDVQQDQVRAFVDEHEDKLESVSSSVKSATSGIKENLAWMETTGSDVWRWLWHQSQYKVKS